MRRMHSGNIIKFNNMFSMFSMTVLKMQRTLLVRQVNDAVRITISKAEHILNSQSEWHQAPLVRIVSMSGLQEDQGAGRESLLQVGERGGGGGW